MTIVQDYQGCRGDGFGIAESIRTAVSMDPDLTLAQVIEALATINVNPGTIRIQFAKSRAIDATLV